MKKQTNPQRPDAKTLRNFMAGKALVADIVTKAREISDEGSDRAFLQARYRGRNIPQDVFVRPFLQKLLGKPELLEGFAAALGDTLALAGNALECPDATRATTWDDIVGHAHTQYCAEEEPLPVERQPLEIILDKLDEHLTAAAAVCLPPDCLKLIEEAVKASALTRLASGSLEVEAHLQQIRRYVYEARTDHRMVADHPENDPLRLALREMLAAHRLLNECLGGVMIEERENEPRGPLGKLLGRLDHYLDGTEHVGNGTADAVFDLMHSDVHSLYFGAQEAEARGDEAGALRLLPELRAGVAKAFAACDENDGRWALLKVSLDLLDEFAGDSEQSIIAAKAACFISRLSEHLSELQAKNRPIESDDILAIHQAASVIMSADGGDTGLEEELEKALETATVLFTDQPPKSTGLQAVERGQVISKKRLAGALG